MNGDKDKKSRVGASQRRDDGAGDVSGGTSSDFHSDDDYAWIPWFCSLKGNEFFCEVEESFAQDGFNLTGLNAQVQYYDQALDMILDIEPNPDDILTDEQQELVENDAENLFGLIHARYILTNRGLHAMLEKYKHGHFGRCPRVLCRGQSTLPIGMSDMTNQDSVKLYCPRCEEAYASKSSRHEHIDGAYFGTTFAHLFFLTFPELKVAKSLETFTPRVFGFRVHKTAYKRSLEARQRGQDNGDGGPLMATPHDDDGGVIYPAGMAPERKAPAAAASSAVGPATGVVAPTTARSSPTVAASSPAVQGKEDNEEEATKKKPATSRAPAKASAKR